MPESRLEAVIWDMDGVIADTAPYHFMAWQETFQKRGVKFAEEDFKRNFGQRNDTIIRNTLGENLSPGEIDTIANEKEENYRRKVAQNIKSLPGAIELIRSLAGRGVKMAVASSAPMENIQLVIGGLGIGDCFQTIVWGREVAEGKPSPQGFLLAAERLGAEPQNCLVVEDAVAGVAAAKRAGMKCLAVTNTHHKTRLKEADFIADTLRDIGVDGLEKLFNSGEINI